MITQEENERLTRVGPGTPMGELLRRYWLPIAISSEVGQRPVAKRLLGEDLVVFRTTDGKVGVVEERCAHRRTSLAIGICEARGIRCGYHGWLFGHDGVAIEQPAETRLNPNARVQAYPAQELGGLIFTYMGPQPAPLLPRFDLFVMENCIRDIGRVDMDFNFLQAMENSVDPYHAQFLHGHFAAIKRQLENKESTFDRHFQIPHGKIAFDKFDFGIIKRRLLEGESEDADSWKTGHPLVFPIMVKVGSFNSGFHQFQIRVPVDDENTHNIWYTVFTPNTDEPIRQTEIPCYEIPLVEKDDPRMVELVENQDIAAWRAQGRIYDRTRELPGRTDQGIAIFRRMLMEQMDRVAAGEDPLGTIRDPAQNQYVRLPLEKDKGYGRGIDYTMSILNVYSASFSPIRDELIELFQKHGPRVAD